MGPSHWRFIGEIYPTSERQSQQLEVEIEFSFGKTTVALTNDRISLFFVTEPKSFEGLFRQVDIAVKSFLAPQSLTSLVPLTVVWREWSEEPLDGRPLTSGQIKNVDLKSVVLPGSLLTHAITSGMTWHEQMKFSPLLHRAVVDFSYALQQPSSEIPVYLYRVVESAQVYFNGEANLISKLKLEDEVKLVKRIANDAKQGFHTRHAAKTKDVKNLSYDEIQEAVNATVKIVNGFYLAVANEMGGFPP